MMRIEVWRHGLKLVSLGMLVPVDYVKSKCMIGTCHGEPVSPEVSFVLRLKT